jgi:hypothetical protein
MKSDARKHHGLVDGALKYHERGSFLAVLAVNYKNIALNECKDSASRSGGVSVRKYVLKKSNRVDSERGVADTH